YYQKPHCNYFLKTTFNTNMKVVINACYGGFGLSPKAIQKYAEYAGFKVYAYTDADVGPDIMRVDDTENQEVWILYWLKEDIGARVTSKQLNDADWFDDIEVDRGDPILIRVVEELGEEADGKCAALKVVEIPDDVEYTIAEYDGWEHVAEAHRT